MTKTEWFPADVKPVHIGAYEVQNIYVAEADPLFNWWTGNKWTGSVESMCELVMEDRPHIFAIQDRVWRGLTEKAE